MTTTKETLHYQAGEWETNSAAYQISQLVGSRDDVRRLLVPIQESTNLSDDEQQVDAAGELEKLLQTWDDPAFVTHADRAKEILDVLNDLWSGDGPVDMLELGERRVVLDALSLAIARRAP